ncbi:hypothetical protein SDC9_79790 [bioreactor metagenome]|uniref:Uncharacterized protein n=1 Tax=bioreactor metagenome TaxID=1076179 RepID=A0A644YZG6_9ZZZZ
MFSLLLVNFSTVNAKNDPASSLPQPFASHLSGDAEFEVVIVAPAKLMAGTTLDTSLLVPAGFPLGEKQFEGDGLTLSGLDYGKVSLCFPLNAVNQGWGGQVGYWNGSTWQLLETSISTPKESSISWGCATAYQNGQYAFIKWVVNSSLLPKAPAKPTCDFSINMVGFFVEDPITIDDKYIKATALDVLIESSEDLEGKTVSVKLVKSSPASSFLYDDKMKNVLITSGELQPLFTTDFLMVPISGDHTITYKYTENFSITYELDFGDCVILYNQPLLD